MLFVRTLLAACVLAQSCEAHAFKMEYVPPLLIQNDIAVWMTVRDAEVVCPTSALPNVCAGEFRLAKESFLLAGRVIFISAIIDPGREETELLQHAKRLYEQGWSLYISALARYAPRNVAPEVAEESGEKK